MHDGGYLSVWVCVCKRDREVCLWLVCQSRVSAYGTEKELKINERIEFERKIRRRLITSKLESRK